MKTRRYFRKILILISAVTVLNAPIQAVRADEKDDAILREGLKIVAKEAATDLVRRQADKVLGQMPFVNASYGTGILSAYEVAVSIDDFAKAQNDEGRAHATAHAAVAVVAIINPAIGAAAQAVLLAYELTESGLAAGHAARMLELEAIIRAHQARILEIENMFVKNEYIELLNMLNMTIAAEDQITVSTQYLQEKCQTADLYADLNQIDACVTHLASIVVLQKTAVVQLDKLLNFKSQRIDLDSFLKSKNENRSDLLVQLSHDRDALHISAEKINNQLKEFGHSLAIALKQKAIHDNLQPEVDQFAEKCIEDSEQFIRRVAIFKIDLHANPNKYLAQILGDYNQATLAEEGSNLKERSCWEIEVDDPLIKSRLDRLHSLFDAAISKVSST